MNISIVSGWLPLVVRCLAVVLLVVAVDWRSGDGRRHIGRGLLIAVVVTGVVTVALTVASVVPSDVPWSAVVWGFTFVLAVCVTVIHWRGARWWRKVSAVAAVVLTLLVTLDAVDQHSGSFPTLQRLVSLDPENVVETPQLKQIRAQVAATGVLPAQGVVFTVTIPAKVSHFATRPATVYLPPAWFAKVTPSLPTLVLLPGEPGSASDWSNDGNADNTADAFASAHHGVAPIIVMPDPNGLLTDDSECVNSKFGNAETYLVDDVPAFARSQFNASDSAGSLAIAGLSAGGTCSVMLALRHPQVYPTFASYSGLPHRSSRRPPRPKPSTSCSVGRRRPSPNTIPPSSSAMGTSTGWPAGSRWATRTWYRPRRPAASRQPPPVQASPPAFWCGRVATTTTCGARPWSTRSRGWPGDSDSPPSPPTNRPPAPRHDQPTVPPVDPCQHRCCWSRMVPVADVTDTPPR